MEIKSTESTESFTKSVYIKDELPACPLLLLPGPWPWPCTARAGFTVQGEQLSTLRPGPAKTYTQICPFKGHVLVPFGNAIGPGTDQVFLLLMREKAQSPG